MASNAVPGMPGNNPEAIKARQDLFLEAFEELGKKFTTAPQIVIDGIHIGGYLELLNYFQRKTQHNGEPK